MVFVSTGDGHLVSLDRERWREEGETALAAQSLWTDLQIPSTGTIHDITFDPTGQLWAATDEGVFAQVSEGENEGSSWSRFGTEHGLPHQEVFAIQALGPDEIVAAGRGGLSLGGRAKGFVPEGFREGLPGHSAFDVMVAANTVWTRGKYGTAKHTNLAGWREAVDARRDTEQEAEETMENAEGDEAQP